MTSLPPPPPRAVIPPPPPPPPPPEPYDLPLWILLLAMAIAALIWPVTLTVILIMNLTNWDQPVVDITRNDPMWDRRDYTCGRRPFSNADSDGSGMG